MRTSSIIIIGSAVVFALASACSAEAADIVRAKFHFSRAQTNADQFRQDLRQCQITSKRMSLDTSSALRFGTNINLSGRTYLRIGTRSMPITTSAAALQNCMGGKGYRLDPDGFDSGWMRMSI